MKAPPRPILTACICSFVILCFSLGAPDGTVQAGPRTKSESPRALLIEAREVAASIDDRTERSAALDSLLIAQIAIDPSEARETLRAFPKLPNKVNYLTALAAAFAKTGNVAETERLYAEVVVEGESSHSGKLVTANALGQVAIAYANKGNLEEAFRTLDRLKERTNQDPPPVVGIATAKLAEAQAKSGDVDGAVKTALSIAGDNPLPLMNIVAESVRSGKSQQAQDIVARLDDAPQRYAQWGIVQAQIEQGRLIDAQVTASAVKPGHAKASALLELAAHHRKRGAKPLALTLLHEAEDSAHTTINEWARADILRHVAAETARAGDADRAVVIARSIEQERQRNSALYEIVEAQAQRGDFGSAFNTATLLKELPGTAVFKAPPYDLAVCDILGEMVKAGKATEAKETAARLEETKMRRISLYTAIATAYADAGKIKEAHATLALAETEGQRRERRKELRQLVDKAPLGPADERRLQELRKIDHDLQPALEAIARALARQGNVNGAMAVADGLTEPPARLRLISDLGSLHVQAGHKTDTLRWARNLATPSEKISALVGIATALSDETEKRKAKPDRSTKTAFTPSPPTRARRAFSASLGGQPKLWTYSPEGRTQLPPLAAVAL